jgi:pimeloyl-ACP methyl ester carboxylesterase
MLREAEALRKQSVLLRRHLRPRTVHLPAAGPPVDVVFLLHGVLATAGVFELLERRLRQAGIEHVASFSYHPLRSVESLARELARACDSMPTRARVHLVGHSLGGVVSQYYVRLLGGASRVVQTISLASPFRGTTLLHALPSSFARIAPITSELAPGSALLARMLEGPEGIPHTSLVAAEDQLVTPVESAIFPWGEVVIIEGVGHNALLFDEEAARVVVSRVLRRAVRPPR